MLAFVKREEMATWSPRRRARVVHAWSWRDPPAAHGER
jgi:hypothetical protein